MAGCESNEDPYSLLAPPLLVVEILEGDDALSSWEKSADG